MRETLLEMSMRKISVRSELMALFRRSSKIYISMQNVFVFAGVTQDILQHFARHFWLNVPNLMK